jgi:hypothetical protein
MISDTEIRLNGMKTLIENLGLVEAERFIVLLQREPFDYTKWRESLWKGKTVREISADAMEYQKKLNKTDAKNSTI